MKRLLKVICTVAFFGFACAFIGCSSDAGSEDPTDVPGSEQIGGDETVTGPDGSTVIVKKYMTKPGVYVCDGKIVDLNELVDATKCLKITQNMTGEGLDITIKNDDGSEVFKPSNSFSCFKIYVNGIQVTDWVSDPHFVYPLVSGGVKYRVTVTIEKEYQDADAGVKSTYVKAWGEAELTADGGIGPVTLTRSADFTVDHEGNVTIKSQPEYSKSLSSYPEFSIKTRVYFAYGYEDWIGGAPIIWYGGLMFDEDGKTEKNLYLDGEAYETGFYRGFAQVNNWIYYTAKNGKEYQLSPVMADGVKESRYALSYLYPFEALCSEVTSFDYGTWGPYTVDEDNADEYTIVTLNKVKYLVEGVPNSWSNYDYYPKSN